jgi:hypothetical protein
MASPAPFDSDRRAWQNERKAVLGRSVATPVAEGIYFMSVWAESKTAAGKVAILR